MNRPTPMPISVTDEPPVTIYSDQETRIVRRERRQFRVFDGGLAD